MDRFFKWPFFTWRSRIASALCLLAFAAFAATPSEKLMAAGSAEVILFDIDGPISVGSQQHFSEALEFARKNDAQLLIMRLDTPGGLVSVTREIISGVLNSNIPIAVYVAPNGARAASAGTYLAYAAHVSAMAPGTHLGAATPIPIGAPPSPSPLAPGKPADESPKPSQSSAMEKKAINDAVAYLRALAQLRSRNAEWAEKAVTDAATLTAREAEKENVVDLLADDVAALLQKVDGKQITTPAGNRTLRTAGLSVRYMELSWQSRLISIFTDPNVAFILLLIGVYGIMFEFWSPGLAGPGIVGAISLLIGLMGLSALPVSFVGAGLLLLGIAFLAAEAFAPGFGILGLGGIIAFVLGSLFLFDPSGADFELAIAWPVIAGAALTTLAMFGGLLAMVVRSRQQAVATGGEELIGMRGEILAWSGGKGRVRVHGEIWAATGVKPLELEPGNQVKVSGRIGLTLLVAPAN